MSHSVATKWSREAEEDLIEFIRSRFIPDDQEGWAFEAETPLFEDGLINSINLLALIGFVECRKGRRLDDAEILMPNFRSVRAIASAFFGEDRR